MTQKIKRTIILAATSLVLLAPGLLPALASTAFAQSAIQSNLCTGTSDAAGDNTSSTCGTAGSGNGTNDLQGVASRIVDVFSVIVGVVAVIMIIYGGFRYITSGGDTNNVGTAKNTLIYAVVGLVIVALAQVIVHYVINTATSSGTSLGT